MNPGKLVTEKMRLRRREETKKKWSSNSLYGLIFLVVGLKDTLALPCDSWGWTFSLSQAALVPLRYSEDPQKMHH